MIPGSLEHGEIQEAPSQTWLLDDVKKRIVEPLNGAGAVIQAALLALRTQRCCYAVFSTEYGNEQHTLLGTEDAYAFSESKRMICEALSTDTRIKNVRNFTFSGGAISFTIDTIYGAEKIETEVMNS